MAEKDEKNLEEIIEDDTSYTSTESTKSNTLQRGLKARHIQMIALGGTIGK